MRRGFTGLPEAATSVAVTGSTASSVASSTRSTSSISASRRPASSTACSMTTGRPSSHDLLVHMPRLHHPRTRSSPEATPIARKFIPLVPFTLASW